MNWTRHATIRDQAARGGDAGATHYSWTTRYTDAKAGAVQIVACYTIHAGHGQYRVAIEQESILCSDVTNPGDTETRADTDYEDLPPLYASIDAADQVAERLAHQHRASDIRWLL